MFLASNNVILGRPMHPRPAATLRRHQRHTEARQAILDAAHELLLEAGTDGFTMRRLADRCGYTAPTIYHYFGDKQGLLDTLLEQVLRELLAELERVPTAADPLDIMRAHFHAIVRFGVANPRHYRLLLTTRPQDAPPLPSDEAARQRLEAPLEQLFRERRLRGELEPTRQALWSLMHGLISLQTSRPDVAWEPQLGRLGLEAMLEGLLAPAAKGDVS
jgi:AcrR family transcriptional regulator